LAKREIGENGQMGNFNFGKESLLANLQVLQNRLSIKVFFSFAKMVIRKKMVIGKDGLAKLGGNRQSDFRRSAETSLMHDK